VATGIVVGDKPRYRYPLEPIVGIVALAGVGMLADAVVGFKQRALSRSRAKQLSATAS
jgi:hypothetical protein